jgi:hypothetical protein
MPLLIAAQLLLAVPAMASVPAASPSQDMAHDGSACHEMPCCPDGAESMADCLASCTLIAAVAPDISPVHVPTRTADMFVAPSSAVASLSEPPLKPPPIA